MPEHPQPKARLHPWAEHEDRGSREPATPPSLRRSVASSLPSYVELQVTSNFSFLRGASHPEELVERAAALGHGAAAISDRNSLAGIVRAHLAAKQAGIRLVVGCRLEMRSPGDCPLGDCPPPLLSVLVYPTDRAAYGRLCRLLSLGKRRAPKGQCDLAVHDLIEHQEGLLAVALAPADLDGDFVEVLRGLKGVFDGDRLSIAASRLYGPDDGERLRQLRALAQHVGVPLVATNDVHYHDAHRRALQDVLGCIRHGCTVADAGFRLFPHAERHLKPPEEMGRLFATEPGALARSAEIAARATFSLDELRYQYPEETCPAGRSPIEHLSELAWSGAAQRYPRGVPEKVARQVEHELRLIEELDYPRYFLTVHDLVLFARGRGILCQGRGAAANSAVCYCLGVTAVDPDCIDLLFERFVSRERKEPPDIDIDFEHERREEVIQYLYRKYGRDRAALTAEVISYRGRSAVREVGKALGLSLDCVERLAGNLDWWDHDGLAPERLRELGLNPQDPTVANFLGLVRELLGFPRHLSQHVGGFVITRDPLCELVPIENAAMEDRTVIEWDKDDIDAMGMLKVDVLGLGMLTCIRKAFDLVNEATERRSDEATKGGQDGDREDFSRPYCVAEGDDSGTADLSGNTENAAPGAIRADDAIASCGNFGSIEHCRRACSGKQGRLPEIPANRPGLVGRVGNAVRARNFDGHDDKRPLSHGSHEGSRSHSSGTDQKPGTEEQSCVAHPSSLRRFVAPSLSLHTVPPEDPAVYDMICAADTVGVFQIESRAQMSMLPRLRPRCFYDLVIEVAIVRPGPIQGNMVHPYLRRRNGEEPVTFPSEDVRGVLGKTLGVPLFQEQAMKLAIVAAGFTPDEADQLRRSMAAWKRKGDQIERFGRRLIEGMAARGYPLEFAQRCFEQIKGFSEYGFPESHAASFALLVYVSAWLKKHHPGAFAAALINSQPMGFYAPAQIVRDAAAHGVEVRPVDVNRSALDCTLEESDGATERRSDEGGRPALRLGLRLVRGLGEEEALRITAAVEAHGPFASVTALWRASGARVSTLRHLAAADAFGSMGLDRQAALWEIRALRDEALPLFEEKLLEPFSAAENGSRSPLPRISAPRKVIQDYASIGLSLKAHPVSFLREHLAARGAVPAAQFADARLWPHGSRAAVAGLVLVRQRPGTASGIVFMTLEDETGTANLIVRPPVYERYRRAARHGVIVLARGRVERQGDVVHLLAESIESAEQELGGLLVQSHDFH